MIWNDADNNWPAFQAKIKNRWNRITDVGFGASADESACPRSKVLRSHGGLLPELDVDPDVDIDLDEYLRRRRGVE